MYILKYYISLDKCVPYDMISGYDILEYKSNVHDILR